VLYSGERVVEMKTTLQLFCVISVSCGIVIEALYGADIGFILITTGSLAFGISTKIHNRVHKDEYNNNKGR